MQNVNKSHVFNEEMLTMLKQQVTKLKLMNNELELKDQQILLLKDTIKSLEDEKDEQTQSNNKLKANMRLLFEEVNSRNTKYEQLINALEHEKTRLFEQNQSNKKIIQQNDQQLQRLNKSLREAQNKNQQISIEIKQFRERIKQYSNNQKQNKNEADTYKREARELKQLNKKLSQELEVAHSQLTFSKQQINLIKAKYEEALENAQSRFRESVAQKNKLKTYQTAERNLQSLTDKYNSLKNESDRLKQTLFQKQRQALIAKEANMVLQQEKLSRDVQTRLDLKNLLQIQNFNHKVVTEFTSPYQHQFQMVERVMLEVVKKHEKCDREIQARQETINQLKKSLNLKQNDFKEIQSQLQIIRMNCNNDIQKIEYSYQEKLKILEVQLNKEQKQLIKLRTRDREFSEIGDQLEKVKQQTLKQQQLKIKQIEDLRLQNDRLQNELMQMYPMCEESIITKSRFHSLRNITSHIIRHLFYFFEKIQSNLQYTLLLKNLYFYYDRTGHKKKKINRFKVVAIALVASIRLRNLCKKYRKTNAKDSIIIRDKALRRLIKQSTLLDKNYVTPDYLEQITRVLYRKNLEESIAVDQLLQSYQQIYEPSIAVYRSINTRRIQETHLK